MGQGVLLLASTRAVLRPLTERGGRRGIHTFPGLADESVQ